MFKDPDERKQRLLGIKLISARVNLGMNKSKIADKLFLTIAEYSEIECGRTEPTTKQKIIISKLLNLGEDFFEDV